MVDILLLYFQHFSLFFVKDKFPSKMVVRFNLLAPELFF